MTFMLTEKTVDAGSLYLVEDTTERFHTYLFADTNKNGGIALRWFNAAMTGYLSNCHDHNHWFDTPAVIIKENITFSEAAEHCHEIALKWFTEEEIADEKAEDESIRNQLTQEL